MRRKTGFDALARLGAGFCVLAGLLVLHWSILPLASVQNGGNPTTARAGLTAAERTADPAIPARDIVRDIGLEAQRFNGRAKAPALSGGAPPLALVPEVAPLYAVPSSALATSPPRTGLSRALSRVFDARGPPQAAA